MPAGGSKQTMSHIVNECPLTDEIPWWASGASLCKLIFHHLVSQAQHTLEEESNGQMDEVCSHKVRLHEKSSFDPHIVPQYCGRSVVYLLPNVGRGLAIHQVGIVKLVPTSSTLPQRRGYVAADSLQDAENGRARRLSFVLDPNLTSSSATKCSKLFETLV